MQTKAQTWAFTIAALMLCICSAGSPAQDISAACEPHLVTAAQVEGVPVGLLYAIAMTESGNGGSLSPFAMNVEGKTVLSNSREEALKAFGQAADDGKRLIDVGCMQINAHYHRGSFRSVEDMFEPRQNVIFAAKFLKSLHNKHGTWTAAVSRYHAGPKNKPAQKRYVCRVLTHLVGMHFGNWTPEARAFCA
jgi:soluble lytic murein transglycosylase-like protein